jgi:hypothetical protein
MDIMGRLACHLSETTEFGCKDVRETLELHTEGRLAMDQARTAIQEPAVQEGLEESRLEAVRAILKQEQVVLAKQANDKKIARAAELAAKDKLAQESKARLAKVALDKRNQAEDARRVEAEEKAARDRHDWEVVPRTGLIAKKKTAEAYKWADVVDRQLVKRDDVPNKSEAYK